MNRDYKKFTPNEIAKAVEEFKEEASEDQVSNSEGPTKNEVEDIQEYQQQVTEVPAGLPDVDQVTWPNGVIEPIHLDEGEKGKEHKYYTNPLIDARNKFVLEETQKEAAIDPKLEKTARENYQHLLGEVKSYIDSINPRDIAVERGECHSIGFFYDKLESEHFDAEFDDKEARKALKLPDGVSFGYTREGSHNLDFVYLSPNSLSVDFYNKYREKQNELRTAQSRQLGSDRLHKLLQNLERQMQRIHNDAAEAIQSTIYELSSNRGYEPHLQISSKDARELFKALFFISEHNNENIHIGGEFMLDLDREALVKEIKDKTGIDVTISSHIWAWHEDASYDNLNRTIIRPLPFVSSEITTLQGSIAPEVAQAIKDLVYAKMQQVAEGPKNVRFYHHSS